MAIPFITEAGVDPAAVVRSYLRDGADSAEMDIDGSATEAEFKYTVPADGEFLMLGLSFGIIDAEVEPHKFGNETALSNGLLFQLRDDQDAVALDMCDGLAIKRNADFALIDGGQFSRLEGSANSFLRSTWQASGDDEPIILPAGWSVVVTVRDDLSRLEFFRGMVKGRFIADG